MSNLVKILTDNKDFSVLHDNQQAGDVCHLYLVVETYFDALNKGKQIQNNRFYILNRVKTDGETSHTIQFKTATIVGRKFSKLKK